MLIKLVYSKKKLIGGTRHLITKGLFVNILLMKLLVTYTENCVILISWGKNSFPSDEPSLVLEH